MSGRRIGIAAWNAGPAVVPASGRRVGGLETFAWRFARALAVDENRRVTLVFRERAWRHSGRISGVELRPLLEPLREMRGSVSNCLRRVDGFPWFSADRFRPELLWQVPILGVARLWSSERSRWRSLEHHLRGIRPDAWLALGCSAESAAVVRVARELGTPVLLWLQSNSDIDPRFFEEPDYRNGYGVRSEDALYGVEHATEVLCQTDDQMDLLRGLTGREGVLIRNPIDCGPWKRGASEDRDYVLWIGRYDRMHKRPEMCLEIARRLPRIPFRMVINRGDEEVERVVRAALPANVTLIDYVESRAMPEMFGRARMFVSTSSRAYEGFPNVLLESVCSGTPIASLEDFDGFLRRSGSGVCANENLDRLAELIGQLWDDADARARHVAAGREYVAREHGVDAAVAKFTEVLERVCDARLA